jgi:PIN domain nuclease of toxin-antitoxin system
MDYVTDAHSLIWYFTDDQKLSENAFNAYEQTIEKGSIFIPIIALAEIMYICQRGRISLTFKDTLDKIEEYENFQIIALDLEILKIADRLSTYLEMHDRLIVATAICFDVPLITKDEQIQKSKLVKTIW